MFIDLCTKLIQIYKMKAPEKKNHKKAKKLKEKSFLEEEVEPEKPKKCCRQ